MSTADNIFLMNKQTLTNDFGTLPYNVIINELAKIVV